MLILVLELRLCLFTLFSCKVRNHIANCSTFYFFMPYDALNGSLVEQMCFTLIGTLHLCKWERKGDKNLIFIEKVKWLLHNNRWAQIAKLTSYLFLSIALSYNFLATKLWFELHTILHWIIMPNQKQFKAWHVSRGSQLHNLGSWD